MINIYFPFDEEEFNQMGVLKRMKCQNRYNRMYGFQWWTVYVLTTGPFWYMLPELQTNENKINSKITFIVLFVTRYNESTNDDEHDEIHISTPGITCLVHVLLMMSQSSARDVASSLTTIVTRAR